MDVSQILKQCLAPDALTRNNAEKALNNARGQNLGAFYAAMLGELCNDARDKNTRHLAGLTIKNCLDAQDEALKKKRAQDWLALPPAVRSSVKDGVLKGLGVALREARSSCAQVIAKIARIEVPVRQWPELVAKLLSNVTRKENPAQLVQSSLEALGYLCEEVDPSNLDQANVNQILTAIVDGMKKPNPEVMYTGCQAMFNALEFVENNFKNEGERNFIMQQICTNASNSDERVRRKSYECVWKVAELYYEHLKPYMQALFAITLKTVKEDKEIVAMQALEFWLTICDKEMDLLQDDEGAKQCAHYIKAALPFLTPLITETLTKQEDEQDEDSWNIAMAGGACLGLMAQVVGVDILPPVISFIQANVNKPDWHLREAAVLAFGSVLSEVTENPLQQTTMSALPILIKMLATDPHPHVKDTTAWTIGQICAFYGTKIEKPVLDQLVTILIKSLAPDVVPRIANNACFALHNLAQAVEQADQGDSDPPTNVLSPYFKAVVENLLKCADREDWEEHNLRTSSYEAVNLIMSCAAQDSIGLVKELIPFLCQKLQASNAKLVASAGSSLSSQKEQFQLQGLLCGALQTSINKLSIDVLPYSDLIMQQLLMVFRMKNATAHEEAFMAIGALANAIEGNFVKYMQAFYPILLQGLKEHEQSQICIVATGVVGDVCRALEDGKLTVTFCDGIVTHLIQNLQSTNLDRAVKPPILAVFGDIALAIGGGFRKYLQAAMKMLFEAGGVKAPEDDEDMIDYVATLHENVLEAYAGIIQGLKGDNMGGLLEPFTNQIGGLLGRMTMDPNRDDHRTRSIAGVLGDLAGTLQHKVKPIVTHDFAKLILRDCLASDEERTKQNGEYLREQVNKFCQ